MRLPQKNSAAPTPVERSDVSLPRGARLLTLTTHRDGRGSFTEVFRKTWRVGARPVQWNLVSSAAGVLRGVHVHVLHTDYLILAKGRATIGLCDLRGDSPSAGRAHLIELDDSRLLGLVIPCGVAHGFYFREPSVHLYAVSEYWNPADELGCFWGDPELGISWPDLHPSVSDRDASLPSLAALRREFAAARAALTGSLSTRAAPQDLTNEAAPPGDAAPRALPR